MFPCTVHDFLMMSTNDALLWRFVFVYLVLSLFLCFLVIKIHVYINLYKRVCYSNKFCNVFYKLFYPPKVSVFTYPHPSAENVNWILVVLWIRLLYIYGCSTQICWYCRISVFYVHLKFIRLVSFRMVLYIYYWYWISFLFSRISLLVK